jgi:hypothetical protein
MFDLWETITSKLFLAFQDHAGKNETYVNPKRIQQ